MSEGQLFELEEDEELRVEVDCAKDETISVELKGGIAEIFGTEMVQNTKYTFKTGAKFAVFTYHGCQILILGKLEVQPYTSKETPMIMYLNIHAGLEQMRVGADTSGSGPVTMVVGPTDVGKSTLCRLLLNYAVRNGRRPLFVDLDVGQGSIGTPGAIGSVLVERPASIEEGFSQNAPLVYHYGHLTPGHNSMLYNKLVSRMADVVRERIQTNRKVEASGVIINTCGWVRGEGYNQIKHIAQAFEVDVILVLDQERVYNDLVRDMPDFVKVVWLPKSGGVVERPSDQRIHARDARIKEYFYGPKGNLFPHSIELKFADLKDRIYKIGGPNLPDSCMPLGSKSENNQTKLVSVHLSERELSNRILAVTFSTTTEDLILNSVAGFICVTEINVKEQKLTVLSPQPKPLPKTLLLLSDIQFVDSS